MGAFIDITGQVFGRLTVLSRSETRKKTTYWLCECQCGKKVVVSSQNLRGGNSKSCRCMQKEIASKLNKTHGNTVGKKPTKEYRAWCHMLSRCNNANVKEYKYYGARGISVCERWREFENFLADMGKCGPSQSIERKDNSKGYSKENCVWANSVTQQRNKRSVRKIEHDGKTLTIPEWSEIMGISRTTIWWRLKSGWSSRDAIATPVKTQAGEKKQ